MDPYVHTVLRSVGAPVLHLAQPQIPLYERASREALAHLNYGLQDGGGFVLLTGEVGTGKTTVSRCLLQQLPADTEIAYILNPSLTERDLLAAICDEFQLPHYGEEASLKQLFDLIRDHLLANLAAGKRSVVLVDEAQHLLPGVLEQLRLLTNLETDEKKLLQVVLIGQPELQQMLRQPRCASWPSAITARYHLLPLSRQDVDAYVRFRLQVAGCVQPIFTPRAIQTCIASPGHSPPHQPHLRPRPDRRLRPWQPQDSARGHQPVRVEVSGIRDEGWQSGLTVAWWAPCWSPPAGGAGNSSVLPARPWSRSRVPVKVDDTPEQQAQLTRAINQALEPDVAMQNLYKVWGYQAELGGGNLRQCPRAGLRCQEGRSLPGAIAGAAIPGPHQSDRRDRRPLLPATLVSLGRTRLPCSSATRAGRWTGSGSPTPGAAATPCSGACPGATCPDSEQCRGCPGAVAGQRP